MEYRRVIQEFPNGTNINLIPILTPEEEKARHQRLNDAAGVAAGTGKGTQGKANENRHMRCGLVDKQEGGETNADKG